MKRLIFPALVVFAAFMFYRAYSSSRAYRVEGEPQVAAIITDRPTQPPTAIPTSTIVPTVTVDYQQTAAVAQSTAAEAIRVNAGITAAFEQRVQEQLQMTAQVDREWFAVQSWTHEAAPTSIPLTATQQAALNTQIPYQQSIVLAQITATWGAPTQMVAIANAEQTVMFGRTNNVIATIGKIALIVLCFVLSIYLVYLMVFRRTVNDEPTEIEEVAPPTETVIQLKRDNGQGMGNTERLVVPCSPEQLTELAELAVNGERTFAINRLESNSRTLRRETLYAFRNFAVKSRLAFHTKPGSQEIALNDDGLCFLEGWWENHELPGGYEFEEGQELEHA